MKISFEVESNQAALLITFFDLITKVEVEDSNTLSSNFEWLIDEMLTEVPRIFEIEIDCLSGREFTDYTIYHQIIYLLTCFMKGQKPQYTIQGDQTINDRVTSLLVELTHKEPK